MRRPMAGLALAVAVGALSGCSGTGPKQAAPTPAASEDAAPPAGKVLVASSDDSVPAPIVPETPATAPSSPKDSASNSIEVRLLAGKQAHFPSAWIAHAAANESLCSQSRCPYTVQAEQTAPAKPAPFAQDPECLLTGGTPIEGGQDYEAAAQAGAAQAAFQTDVSGGDDFVELDLHGQAAANPPTTDAVRADAGARLVTDESALVLDVKNPDGGPVALEVTWSLAGRAARGEASWQGALWYAEAASHFSECYTAPDYVGNRVFNVFQDVDGRVRGKPAGSVRIPLDNPSGDDRHFQVGLRLDVGAHAVGRQGSKPALAVSSASQVDATIGFRIVPIDE